MADIYVRSTDGSDADNGSTWALAKATLAGAALIEAAGDTVYVSQAHAESSASNQNWNWVGNKASPNRIIAANDASEPPTAAASGSPSITTTGSGSQSFSFDNNGTNFYVYGINFLVGTGNNAPTFSCYQTGGAVSAVFENCFFSLVATGAAIINVSSSTTAGAYCFWQNCTVKFAADSQNIRMTGSFNMFHWKGGSFVAGTQSPNSGSNAVFTNQGTNVASNVLLEDVDFSNLGTGVFFHNGGTNTPQSFVMRNCKLPSGWSGGLYRQTLTAGQARFAMYNCSAGAQNYKLWIQQLEGSIRDEATIIRTFGATDGTTGISWKFVTTANGCNEVSYFESDPVAYYNSAVGLPLTVTMHFLHDSGSGLTDADIWIDVSYLSSSSAPLGTFVSSHRATPLTSASTYAASSAAWNTSGLASPNKQQMSVTFTPQMRGMILVRAVVAKASYTVYVCPKFEIS